MKLDVNERGEYGELEKKVVSGIMLILLLIGMSTLAFNIQPVGADWTWTETIYIRADGSVYPDTAPILSADKITYTLTDNILGDIPQWPPAIVVERDNIVVDGAGHKVGRRFGYAVGCGIYLAYRSNVTLKDIIVVSVSRGISLIYSSNNVLSGIESSINDGVGIYLFHSNNNNLSGNIVAFNYGPGIWLESSSSNVLSGNTAWSNFDPGICLTSSSNNNVLSGNTIAYNTWGIYLGLSSNNIFFHNNIIDNCFEPVIVRPSGYANTWDNGYPSGGNYWHWEAPPNYSQSDKFSGVNQDMPGADGIRDWGYTIDAGNRDRYPLVKPYVAHDIGIATITPSETQVDPGFMLDIDVRVVNYGSNTETFSLTAYANTTAVNQTEVTLSSRDSATITLTWDTTGMTPGTYTLKAQASTVPGETDTTDNTFIDGQVTLIVHDIAITQVKLSKTQVLVGDEVWVHVTVKNEGNVPEIFNVTAFYNDTPFGCWTHMPLNAGDSITLPFGWYVFGVAVGNYTIKAQASIIPREIDTADNCFEDGVVTVVGSAYLTRKLIETIETWNLREGTENSLTSKLEDAIHLLNKGNQVGAIHKLMDFINQVEALRDKNLTNEQADYLVAEAQRIIDFTNG